MSSIFREDEELRNTKSLAHEIRRAADSSVKMEMNVPMMTLLATNWPDENVARQIILMTCVILKKHNINPKDVKW